MTSESNNNNNLQHMDNAAADDDDEGVKVSTATNHKEPSAVDGLSRTSKTEEVMSAGSSHNNRDGGGHENQNNNKNNKNNDDILPTSATEKVDDTLMIGDYSVDYLVERALKKIDKRTSDWEVLNHTMDVPALSISEIEIGRFLGEGGFFKVHEIQKITLENDGDDESETQAHEMEELKAMTTTSQTRSEDVESSATAVAQNRRYMEKHYCRVGKNGQMDCRFAIKTMKKGALSDPGLFVNTLVDMAIEAKFLCSMRHPNIIKMRGISTNFIHAGSDSFIILDRLYQTLSEKMDSWKHKKENSFSFAFDFRGKKTKAFLAERLTVGFDIANALEYLHDRK
jgi:Protein tyrosine and serine/threonine kinase